MVLTIIAFFVILNILVFIHEFGHFIVAKKLGMGVEEFGFGLPPRLWGKKFKGLLISLNWLPIGGFVRLSGEDIDESVKREALSGKELNKYFFARPKWQRSAVLLAGVSMNFLLAVIIISYIFTQGVFVPTQRVHVEKVTENSPAAVAGLVENDVILSFAGSAIKTSDEMISLSKNKGGEAVRIVVERNGEEKELILTPRKDPPSGEGPLGVIISNLEEKKYSLWQAPFYGTIEALKISWLMLSSLATMLWKLMTFQSQQVDVAGPIGIAQATGEAVKQGYMAVLQLAGLLSLNLALFNILPIPALDGGRLFFVLTEDIFGKKFKAKFEAAAHQIGFLVLIGLVILVTINDVVRIIRG